MSASPRPLVAHVVFNFDVGGLENGVVNLINHMPADAYRHAVISLTGITDFKNRIRRDDVEFVALGKPPGHAVKIYPALYRLFRKLKPAIVHSRNLAALEVAVPAWAAGVPVRIHGEHGRDVGDVDGSNRKYQRLRRVYRPFVNRYIAVSRDLNDYLIKRVGVPGRKVAQIYNGVDAVKFRPDDNAGLPPEIEHWGAGKWVAGTVGRMQPIKGQTDLARAFVRALEIAPALRERLRLVMIGDGPLRAEAQLILERAGASALAWLPGERNDIAALMRSFDCFVLPSLGEGISNTILEAMATGLPVVATSVGGNPELVIQGRTGTLVPSADPETMANAIVRLASDPATAAAFGRNGRAAVEATYSMDSMVRAYRAVYDQELGRLATF